MRIVRRSLSLIAHLAASISEGLSRWEFEGKEPLKPQPTWQAQLHERFVSRRAGPEDDAPPGPIGNLRQTVLERLHKTH